MAAKFCFPIRIEFDHRDYLIFFAILLHLLGVAVLIPWFGKGIFLVGLCIIIMSLRYFIAQQRVLRRYVALVGADVGQWYLESRESDRCSVTLEGVLFLGKYGVICIRRYGAYSYWLTHVSLQNDAQWHRLKVFVGFYLR